MFRLGFQVYCISVSVKQLLSFNLIKAKNKDWLLFIPTVDLGWNNAKVNHAAVICAKQEQH